MVYFAGTSITTGETITKVQSEEGQIERYAVINYKLMHVGDEYKRNGNGGFAGINRLFVIARREDAGVSRYTIKSYTVKNDRAEIDVKTEFVWVQDMRFRDMKLKSIRCGLPFPFLFETDLAKRTQSLLKWSLLLPESIWLNRSVRSVSSSSTALGRYIQGLYLSWQVNPREEPEQTLPEERVLKEKRAENLKEAAKIEIERLKGHRQKNPYQCTYCSGEIRFPTFEEKAHHEVMNHQPVTITNTTTNHYYNSW